jgi:hypothetical protein
MIRFARHALTLLALTGATPALAQDWRIASAAGAKPDRTIYLIDAASITRTGDTVRFTTQSIFESLSGTRDFDRSITLREGDCTAMSSRIVENSYYAAGAFQSKDSTGSQVIAHKPNTIMYGVLEQACGTKPIDGGKIADPETAIRNYFKK